MTDYNCIWKYFHRISKNVSWLDHKLTPEVRACLAAMMSRVPLGGIEARYMELVSAIADDLAEEAGYPTIANMVIHRSEAAQEFMVIAEDKLCEYPLHRKVQTVFNKFVKQYGHSSIMELTGHPVVFVEDISIWLAYLTFDNPLVMGQEMSTRAIWREDWAYADDIPNDPRLQEIHNMGLKIAAAEIEAWKKEFRSSCPDCNGYGVLTMTSMTDTWKIPNVIGEGLVLLPNRNDLFIDGKPRTYAVFKTPTHDVELNLKGCDTCSNTGRKHPTIDPQASAFRPAFDRARWALPGTITTGVAHTANLRVMARVIDLIERIVHISDGGTGIHQNAIRILNDVKTAYRQAMPGMADMGLREAVYSHGNAGVFIPGHINMNVPEAYSYNNNVISVDTDVSGVGFDKTPYLRHNKQSYMDPTYNRTRVTTSIPCSWAVARDWHRHRTSYPWGLSVSTDTDGNIGIYHMYKPISDIGIAMYEEYMALVTNAHHHFMYNNDQYSAMIALHLGAEVTMTGQAGLRDAVYTYELRANAHGANFEYEAQAKYVLDILYDFIDE